MQSWPSWPKDNGLEFCGAVKIAPVDFWAEELPAGIPGLSLSVITPSRARAGGLWHLATQAILVKGRYMSQEPTKMRSSAWPGVSTSKALACSGLGGRTVVKAFALYMV